MKVTLPGALFLLFLGLKLGGAIDWSWWWITCPLWGVFSVVFVFCALIGVVVAVKEACK